MQDTYVLLVELFWYVVLVSSVWKNLFNLLCVWILFWNTSSHSRFRLFFLNIFLIKNITKKNFNA